MRRCLLAVLLAALLACLIAARSRVAALSCYAADDISLDRLFACSLVLMIVRSAASAAAVAASAAAVAASAHSCRSLAVALHS